MDSLDRAIAFFILSALWVAEFRAHSTEDNFTKTYASEHYTFFRHPSFARGEAGACSSRRSRRMFPSNVLGAAATRTKRQGL